MKTIGVCDQHNKRHGLPLEKLVYVPVPHSCLCPPPLLHTGTF